MPSSKCAFIGENSGFSPPTTVLIRCLNHFLNDISYMVSLVKERMGSFISVSWRCWDPLRTDLSSSTRLLKWGRLQSFFSLGLGNLSTCSGSDATILSWGLSKGVLEGTAIGESGFIFDGHLWYLLRRLTGLCCQGMFWCDCSRVQLLLYNGRWNRSLY